MLTVLNNISGTFQDYIVQGSFRRKVYSIPEINSCQIFAFKIMNPLPLPQSDFTCDPVLPGKQSPQKSMWPQWAPDLIWPHDTDQSVNTLFTIKNSSCQSTVTWMSNIKDVPTVYGNNAPLLYFWRYMSGLLVGRRKKKSNFAGLSGTNSWKKRPILREFRRNFRGQFRWKMIGKEWPISWELPKQILLGSDWFCADLRNVFNETRRSYSFNSGFILQYEIVSLLNVIKTNKKSGH